MNLFRCEPLFCPRLGPEFGDDFLEVFIGQGGRVAEVSDFVLGIDEHHLGEAGHSQGADKCFGGVDGVGELCLDARIRFGII